MGLNHFGGDIADFGEFVFDATKLEEGI